MVQVPAPEALAPPPRAPFKPLPLPYTQAGSKYALAALRNAAERVAHARVSSRHPTCRAQTMNLARLVDAGLLARSDVVRVMVAALVQAGKPQKDTDRVVAWALEHASNRPLPEGVV